MRTANNGFTLVELLVVVAIIVTLMAILAPALDRAIYQAELAVCGSNLHAVTSGVVSYAASFKKRYPYRGAVFDDSAAAFQADSLNYPFSVSGNRNANGYEDRTALVGFVEFKSLVCPMSGHIDLSPGEASKSTWVFANYAMWWGWQYHTPYNGASGRVDPTSAYNRPPGMLKLGDRLTYVGQESTPVTHRFSVLAADHTYNLGWNNVREWTHPDTAGVLSLSISQDKFDPVFTAVHGNANIRITRSTWSGTWTGGGTADLNYLFDDGSVTRFDRVDHTKAGSKGYPLIRAPNSPEVRDDQILFQMLPSTR